MVGYVMIEIIMLFVYLQILISSYHMLLMINGSYLVVPISLHHQHHHHLIRKKIRIFNHSIHYNFLLSNVHFFQGILVYHLFLVLLLLLIILLLLHLIVEELEQIVSTHLTPAVTLSQWILMKVFILIRLRNVHLILLLIQLLTIKILLILCIRFVF